ncbi:MULTISPECIES: GTPase [unclassified Acinetobacter]|uniref:GTPase n=1 Tax=unclassified Acinetobacter TaxID=196816 RepID=UPI0018AA9674|nr:MULTISPECIES: GTPase [unclassified Acinetobacter]MBJ9953262.1 GTPase [Acinetobacter baumannii]
MINKEISEIFQNITVLQRESLSFADPSVESVGAWVATLSIMQLGDTSESVLNAICEIAELNCSEMLRFDLIQVLHPITESILSSLEKSILNQGLSQTDRIEHIIDLSSRIRTYFANVYINIVQRSHQTLTSSKFSFFNFKQKRNLQTARTLATFYALEQLGLLLVQQQMIYSGPLTHQWLTTHHLYELAVKNQEFNININQLQGTHFTIHNIQQAYAQVLLLDIFNTHQIRPSETQALYQCTFDWVKLVQILPRETSLSRYIVDGSKDIPPIYNRKQHANFHTSLYISTQNLLEHINLTIHKETEYLSKNEQIYLSAALKFHVQNVLGTTIERRHERYEYSAQLQICFSLQTAHFYLSKAKNFYETLNLNSNYAFQSESNIHSSISTGSNTASNLSQIKSLDREAKQIYQAQVLDISVNGYRIRWSNEAPRNLRTGEFILINESLNNKWKGAIIRWIKQSIQKTYEVGLEVLAQDIYPCAVKVPADRSTINYHPCLMVQVPNLNESNTSIILPNLPFFKEQQAIYLRLDTDEIKVYLTKTLLITQSFVQFEFELINDEENHRIEQFIQLQSTNLNNQDVWEALK